MAVVYDNARHRKALGRLAKAPLKDKADELAAESRRALAAHRDTGASRINVTRAGVDFLVNLVDTDGGAEAIEFGRAGGTDRKGRKFGPQEGKHILGRHL